MIINLHLAMQTILFHSLNLDEFNISFLYIQYTLNVERTFLSTDAEALSEININEPMDYLQFVVYSH